MTFRLEVQHDGTQFGDVLAVVGSGPDLGDWNPAHAKVLQTNPDVFPSWFIDLPSPVLAHDFKIIVRTDQGQVTWEQISNRQWNLSVVDVGRGLCVVQTVFGQEGLVLQQAPAEVARASRCRFVEAASVTLIPDIAAEVEDTTELFYEWTDYLEFRSEHTDVFAPQKLLHLKDYCNCVVIEQARQRDLRIADDDALSQVAHEFSRRDVDLAIQRAVSEESEPGELSSEESSRQLLNDVADVGRAADLIIQRNVSEESKRGDLSSEESSSSSSTRGAPSQEASSAVSGERSTSAVKKPSWLPFCFEFLLSRRQTKSSPAEPTTVL
eukprot:TRINITY_DN55967_c0_g1_i1.p1 TRINITY_DN55967_c0_g1~~TRINITY_DN55967_c0_g1_i1.p1  ORF type:complete len:339 (-),score=61.55 TRINITY_DN55967_c0_g1_i1:277-1248(-)